MNEITLRAPGTELDDLPLSQGRLAVGRAPEGGLRAVDDAAQARVSFCADRRGTEQEKERNECEILEQKHGEGCLADWAGRSRDG